MSGDVLFVNWKASGFYSQINSQMSSLFDRVVTFCCRRPQTWNNDWKIADFDKYECTGREEQVQMLLIPQVSRWFFSFFLSFFIYFWPEGYGYIYRSIYICVNIYMYIYMYVYLYVYIYKYIKNKYIYKSVRSH
jgi:hypothetical protein